jgi:hypothetical protein
MILGPPGPDEHPPFFNRYLALVPEADILGVLADQPDSLRGVVRAVAGDRETYRYAPGKWSIRQVVGHLTDGERVFGYRAFCFSRQESRALPAFDEDQYVAQADSETRPLADLADEFTIVRQSNLAFLRRLSRDAWGRAGTANENRVTVRALAYVMAGHVRHHVALLHSKYGVDPDA